MKQRFYELDWLRGLCAIFIVLYHYTARYSEYFNTQINFSVTLAFGAGAVSVFFLLSGFLTAVGIGQTTKASAYAKKRFLRLYPTYWVCIILTSLITFFFLKDCFRGIKAILVNFTMLQSFVGVNNVDGVYWTLSYELRFYVYVFVLLLIKKQKWLSKIAVVWLIVSVVIKVLTVNGISHIILRGANIIVSAEYSALFVGGIMLAEIYKKNLKTVWEYIVLAGTVATAFIFMSNDYAIFYTVSCAYILAVIVFRTSPKHSAGYVRGVEKARKILSPLGFIAGISYPLYLLHQYIGFAIIRAFESVGATSEFIILIPIAVIIGAAYLINRFVEKPVIGLFEKKSSLKSDNK